MLYLKRLLGPPPRNRVAHVEGLDGCNQGRESRTVDLVYNNIRQRRGVQWIMCSYYEDSTQPLPPFDLDHIKERL